MKVEIKKAYWKADYSETLYWGVVGDKNLVHPVG